MRDPVIARPDLVLAAYTKGYFPMADSAGPPGAVAWYNPPLRAVLPLDSVHVPRRLRRTIAKNPFEIRIDTAFDAVIDACAAPTRARPDTWIAPDIAAVFKTLHRAGFAHSVECWQGDRLEGGLYGLALGGVFCGESMFSHTTNASKIALVHLCARLRAGGFTLLDCQILNPHTAQFGAYDIPREEYLGILDAALAVKARFSAAEAIPVDNFLREI